MVKMRSPARGQSGVQAGVISQGTMLNLKIVRKGIGAQ